ncbi:hypothetical protein SAMN05421852_11842 [Thermoflavimicrobium dichotomicum]|uniref:Major Facilitator Superfamily protein n=2 Tax=Thermoflavimicrobium dichotomicum TaxID=46223 RepID=A0A1I3TLJ4_9BACL|nr:hypothetical protein SAMN05421852_11842 [Thermoflavimicrobium dichotomicum]
MLTTLSTDTSRFVVTMFMIVVGLGIGASFSVLGMAAIHHFDKSRRGTAQSTIAFLRSLGMAIGVTVFGIIQRNLFTEKLTETFHGASGNGTGAQPPTNSLLNDPHALLSPETRAGIPPQILDQISEALSSSIAQTFVWTLIPAVLSLLCVFLMTKERMQEIKPEPRKAVELDKTKAQ